MFLFFFPLSKEELRYVNEKTGIRWPLPMKKKINDNDRYNFIKSWQQLSKSMINQLYLEYR